VDWGESGHYSTYLHWTGVAPGGTLEGVVGREGEEDGGVLRTVGDDDDGVQFHAVAHRDHDFALDVILVGGWGGGGFRDVGGGDRLRRLLRGGCQAERCEKTCPHQDLFLLWRGGVRIELFHT
jgi:hypothetical protein